jgi:hypothetical protein
MSDDVLWADDHFGHVIANDMSGGEVGRRPLRTHHLIIQPMTHLTAGTGRIAWMMRWSMVSSGSGYGVGG